MKKPVIVMGCTLGLGMVLLASPAAAQSSSTGATKKAPAAQTSKTPAAGTKKPAMSAKPAAKTSALTLKDQRDKVSYALGMSLGTNLHRQAIDVDANIVAQALKDAIGGGKLLLTEDEMKAALTQLQTDMRAKQEEKRKELTEGNKKDGAAFLAANKTKEGVVALPSGLQYKIITAGTGPKPTAGDTVVCNYKGTLINGTEFDSSYKRGQPATFPVSGVIKGWTEALQLMPVGSKWQLFIPSEMAYADRGAGPDIGPNATLIFEVELMSIKPKDEAPAEAPKAPEPKPKEAPKAPDVKN
ncbi:MAG TPA: FKBP-type peptidyl-prolyl cis-trans isomerase [Candidatus Saccharimonadales bacterium]|nr:FKBP-type peptidyl-prolyl cis-trans isomerase [Candidatus Saccharimonadales bacterium]